MGTTKVLTVFDVVDKSSAHLNRMTRAADGLNRAASSAKSTLLGLAAAAGVGFGFREAYQALVGYNEQLTQTKIGIAALLSTSAQFEKGTTAAEKFTQSLTYAPPLLQKLRTMAAQGIGETKDYVQGFQGILKPMMAAGAGTKDILRTTQLLVPVAKTLGMSLDVAARDIQQMMQGRSGAVDALPKFLGMSVGHINKLAKTKPAQLISELTRKLEEWGPAQAAFGETLGAQLDTLKDKVQVIAGAIGEDLTAKLGLSVRKINEWFDKNQSKIDAWVNRVGSKLAHWFERGFEIAVQTFEYLNQHGDELLSTVKAIAVIWAGMKVAGWGQTAFVGVGQAVQAYQTMGTAMGTAGATTATALGGLSVAAGTATAALLMIGANLQWYFKDKAATEAGIAKVKADAAALRVLATGLRYSPGTAEEKRRDERAMGALADRLVPEQLAQPSAEREVVQRLRDTWEQRLTEQKGLPKMGGEAYASAQQELRVLTDPDLMKRMGLKEIPSHLVANLMQLPELKGEIKTPPTINNDFRGSTIKVELDAKDKDPDAIAISMTNMITRQALFPTRSPLAPSLAR